MTLKEKLVEKLRAYILAKTLIDRETDKLFVYKLEKIEWSLAEIVFAFMGLLIIFLIFQGLMFLIYAGYWTMKCEISYDDHIISAGRMDDVNNFMIGKDLLPVNITEFKKLTLYNYNTT